MVTGLALVVLGIARTTSAVFTLLKKSLIQNLRLDISGICEEKRGRKIGPDQEL